ncbi:ABC transporter ATP-binding protein [Nocardioides campestrisoli]|uniref:ABC transporter ATP-binding protein n=1 Tax=Nocardioides campestrisoli TaxID=2736757 RepID=UPI0015E6916F|nr:ABC transporter ATP-binding protein [Nocardioides campestrisoli]
MPDEEDLRPALSLRGACAAYDGKPALVDVSLDLPAGEVLAVLGPSGCGKSTLLRVVAGLEPLSAGTVLFDGDDLAGRPTHRRGFSLMFQDGQLFAHLSVARNVGYALRLARRPRAEVRSRVAELLALVGLAGYEDRMPATLSGGERQRVALARALAVRPRLLLLDEPLSALDAALRESLAADLRAILVAAGTTAVMVTHDHEEAFAVADRLAVMFRGRVVQQGPIGEVWARPADEETATFLGYPTVLAGEPADRLARAAGLAGGRVLALRRSALRVDPEGPVAATVTAAVATPELLRLQVDVPDVGALHAVASRGAQVTVGQEVRLAVDPDRLAPVGARTEVSRSL